MRVEMTMWCGAVKAFAVFRAPPTAATGAVYTINYPALLRPTHLLH
jgi:hypothetical protein